jgi:putative endonuclease
MRAKDAVGRYGERLAVRHVQALGWPVLAQNWRSPEREVPGELDIVALDGCTLVVVEVKTRRRHGRGTALEAVSPDKLRRLRRLVGAWLVARRALEGADRAVPPGFSAVRIDVIAIDLPAVGRPVLLHVRGID